LETGSGQKDEKRDTERVWRRAHGRCCSGFSLSDSRVPISARKRVEEIDSVDRLIGLAERVLTARSLEDLGLVPKRSEAAQ